MAAIENNDQWGIFIEKYNSLPELWKIRNNYSNKNMRNKVYLCEGEKDYPTGKREVACKVVDIKVGTADFVYKFFPRELAILTTLKHPNVIQIFGIFKKNEKYFIFMRYAENKDLLEYVVTNGRVPEPKVRFWTWQIASALSFMHSKDIVHRDLKCENILLTAHSNIKICDFGFGKIISKGDSLSQTWCGSLAYAPPEILEMKPYNPKKVDPWALGVILFVALSKSLPFHEKTPRAMLAMQKRKIQFVGRVWEMVTPLAKISLLKLLEVDPRYRWTPDSVLSCTWLNEDPRIAQLNSSNRTSKSSSISDQRRLSAHLKENSPSISTSSKVTLSNRLLMAQTKESFDYFEDEEDKEEKAESSNNWPKPRGAPSNRTDKTIEQYSED